MQKELSKSVASVVLLGSFAPDGFRLDHLTRHGLLSQDDLQSSQYLELLPGQVVTLRLGSWGRLQVVGDRMSVDSFQPPFVRGCDLALRCLREVAPDSKVRVLGINAEATYKLLDPVERDVLGQRLVPPQAWGNWGRMLTEKMRTLGPLDSGHPGMVTATFREPLPHGRKHGYFDIRIEAVQSAGPPPELGVRFQANDHYDPAKVEGQSEAVRTALMLDAVEQDFESSIARSLEVFEDILNDGVAT